MVNKIDYKSPVSIMKKEQNKEWALQPFEVNYEPYEKAMEKLNEALKQIPRMPQ